MCRWVSMTHLHMHQGVSCLKGMTDDCDVILWCYNHTDYFIWQLYKKVLTQAPGLQFQLGFWQGRPLTLCSSYLSVLHGVRLLNIQGSISSLFISCIHAQGLLGCLKLVFLSCLCVSWVACHPASLKPGIWEARTTAFWRRIALWEQDMTLVSPPKSSSIPMAYIQNTNTHEVLIWQTKILYICEPYLFLHIYNPFIFHVCWSSFFANTYEVFTAIYKIFTFGNHICS